MAGQNEPVTDGSATPIESSKTRRASYTPHSRSGSQTRRLSLTQSIRDLGRSVSIKLQSRQRKVSGQQRDKTPSPPFHDPGYVSNRSSFEDIPQEEEGPKRQMSPPLLPPTPQRSILKVTSTLSSEDSLSSPSAKQQARREEQVVRLDNQPPAVIGTNGGVEWYHRGLGPDMRCNSISDYLDFVSMEVSASPNLEDVQWVNSPLRRVSSYERFRKAYGEYVDLLPPASEAPTNGNKYRWISLKKTLLRRK